MDFKASYTEFWVKYIDFEGVTTRECYWTVFLINFIIGAVIGALYYIPGAGPVFGYIDGLWGLVTLIPSLAIAARRLHDTNRSALHLLWLLLPLVGWIILIVFLAEPATEQKYGQNNQPTNTEQK